MDGSEFHVEARLADTVENLRKQIVEASHGNVHHPFDLVSGTNVLAADALVADIKGDSLQPVMINITAFLGGKRFTKKYEDTTESVHFNDDGTFIYESRYHSIDYSSPRSSWSRTVNAKGNYHLDKCEEDRASSWVINTAGEQDIFESYRISGEANYPGESGSSEKKGETFSMQFTMEELGKWQCTD